MSLSRTPAVLSLVLALASLSAGSAPLASAASSEPAAAPGELIVRFAPAADAGDRATARVEADVDLERALPLPGVQLVKVEPGQSVPAATAELERSAEVVYAEPNFIRRLHTVPNDPLFPNLYGLQNSGQAVDGASGTSDADIDAPEAWDITTGSAQATVAVVDSGVDLAHPDLSSRIWRNPGESGGGRESNGVDDDANGLTDDWRGWDWVADDNLPADENNHGTHVSGTIAASGNDGVGVTGVSWNSRVMPLRMLDAGGSGNVADLVSAYRYAGRKGAQVVNASLGGSGFSRAELDAIDAAPGTLFVVAAGNGGADGVGDDVDTAPEYPCAYAAANIVCVAASDQNDGLARFSNFGAVSVDLAAPGVRTLSTVPGGGYRYFRGTSMATPHAAGAAALIWSLVPGASVTGVRAALLGGTDAKSAFTAKTATGGRLNARRSLELAAASAGLPLPAAPPPVPATETSDPDPVRDAPPAEAAPAPAPGPAPSPGPVPAPAVALDRSAPVLSLALASARRLRRVLSQGLALRARCSERCGLNLSMVVDRRTAKRSGLSRSRRTTVVGRTTAVTTPRGRTISISFDRRARIQLRRLRGVHLTISAVAGDGVGNVRRKSLRVLVRR
ncbi:MAG: S8 family peptidase [Thermoleophilaceae bacterium]